MKNNPPSDEKTGVAPAAVKFTLLLVFLAVLGAIAWRFNLPLAELKDKVGAIAPGIRFPFYVGLYALVSVAPVPGRDVVKVTGAILFGGWPSVFLVYFGEMGAVLLAWVLGRALGKDLVDRLFAGKLQRTQQKIAGATWWQIALLRVFPGTPYRFFNYAGPVTPIRAWPYFAGCLVGTFPRTAFFQLLFAYAGSSIVNRGVTTFQTVIVSVAFAVGALGLWALWARRKKPAREPDQPQ